MKASSVLHRDDFNKTYRVDHSSCLDRSVHEHACAMLKIYCTCNATYSITLTLFNYD